MKKFFILLALALIVLPMVPQAQAATSPHLTDSSSVDQAQAESNYNDSCVGLKPWSQKFCYLIDNIRQILFTIGWVLAVLVIIVGGIVYMTAADDQEKITKAKSIIKNGLIGAAIILLASFLISLVSELLSPLQ